MNEIKQSRRNKTNFLTNDRIIQIELTILQQSYQKTHLVKYAW